MKKNAKFVVKSSFSFNYRFVVQGRTNRWQEALKQLENVPQFEKDEFFLKIWPEETAEAREPPDDSTATAPITTADNIVGGEPKVN